MRARRQWVKGRGHGRSGDCPGRLAECLVVADLAPGHIAERFLFAALMVLRPFELEEVGTAGMTVTVVAKVEEGSDEENAALILMNQEFGSQSI